MVTINNFSFGKNPTKEEKDKLLSALGGSYNRKYDIKFHDGIAPVGWIPNKESAPIPSVEPEVESKEVPKEEAPKVEVPAKREVPVMLTKDKIKALTKAEQTALIRQYDAKVKIPLTEKGRIDLILRLI